MLIFYHKYITFFMYFKLLKGCLLRSYKNDIHSCQAESVLTFLSRGIRGNFEEPQFNFTLSI